MTSEHPGFKKARKALRLSEPVEIDAAQRSIDRANASHYTDSLPPIEQYEITTKADIANSKHRASHEAMEKLNGRLQGNSK